MFSTTIKRSVATLGVLAGLLAVAGPASASGGGDGLPYESISLNASRTSILQDTLVSGYNFKGKVIGLEPNALGTQVGSEGVKAPSRPAYFDLEWEADGIITRRTCSLENTMVSGYVKQFEDSCDR